jgi:putative ATPase
VFEFKAVEPDEIKKALKRGLEKLSENVNLSCEEGVLEHIASLSGGDVRKALNSLELCVLSSLPDEKGNIFVTADTVLQATDKKTLRYDRDGDSHYDILSAFQKSVRGSDADAALHYLARLLISGDLISACRRILVMASEDIGLAYPNAVVIVKACVDSALQLGLPEARIPLSQAVITLATAPKSNSAINAIDAAMAEINSKDVGPIPAHLQDAHYGGAEKSGGCHA